MWSQLAIITTRAFSESRAEGKVGSGTRRPRCAFCVSSKSSQSQQMSIFVASSMLLVITISGPVPTQGAPEGRKLLGARRLAPGSASAHHAFMNQKIMPISPTRSLVTGVGSPARKYQSFPRWVRIPGVSVMLV